jgi:sugar phosphate isomerase/epimerase
VPPGAGRGHPELYSPSSLDERERASAVLHTTRTAEFCAEMGARHVVMHGGYARTRATTQHLIAMAAEGRGNSPAFDKARLKLQMQREKQADRFLAQLRRSIEELLPAFERLGMTLAIENLPSWEAVPSETEMARLLEDFSSARLAYWHDTGHGQIRQNLGFSAHYHWFDRLCPRLAGMHVHDVVPPASDHLMPPAGEVDFGRFAAAARSGVPLVLEPAPGTPPQQIRDALRFLQTLWSAPRPAAEVSAQ